MHLVILAGFVPWYVGMDSYGSFAALIALPGFVQSSFESYAIAVLSASRKKSALRKAIWFVLVPVLVALFFAYTYFLSFFIAVIATIMAALLFYRSYAFAVAISSGSMTSRLMRSDVLIFSAYLGVIVISAGLGIRDYLLPVAMVCGASLLSGWYLLHAPGGANQMNLLSRSEKEESLPKGLAIRAASARFYEDGFLSLSPLVLAAATSSVPAGQFRVFVSAVKAAYKLFPLRYEVAMRELLHGKLRRALLVRASWIFCAISIVVAIVGSFFLDTVEYGWLLVLVASAGASVASLALYPAVSSVDKVMTFWCVGLLVFSFGLAFLWGLLGFALGFAGASYIVMLRSLFVLKIRLQHAMLAQGSN